MKWTIYRHIAPNGKVYIGQTKQSVQARWENGKGYNSYQENESVFWKAIKKYGWQNFSHEIVEDNISSQEEANEREIYWIEYYRSYIGFSDCNGYNMTRGGNNGDHLGYAVFQISRKDLRVLKEFASTAEASRAIGGNEGNASQIRRCCEGKKVSCKGFYWCYKKNHSPTWKPKDNQLVSPILQIDDDFAVVRKYESVTECIRLTNFSQGSIVSCCRRRQRKANGYYWCYISDYDENWRPAEVSFLRNEKIYCPDLNQVYKSAIDASKKTGANRSHILRCCHGIENGANGLHFCYLKDKDKMFFKETQKRGTRYSDEEIVLLKEKYPYLGMCEELIMLFEGRSEDALRQQVHRLGLKYAGENKHCKKIRRVGYDEAFSSIEDAARFVGLKDGSGISKCLKGERTTAAGYCWEYVE